MAFDPVAVAAAVALAQINQKLDGIQATMDQMFDYLRTEDRAADIAALDSLKAILDEYRYNLDNAQFKRLKLALVQDVNSHARERIAELRINLSKTSGKKGLFELRGQTEDDAVAALDLLKDYQLAVYLYSFSTFLGVMLLENYDEGYLASKARDIRKKGIEYRKAYGACLDAIESRNRETLDSNLLGGLSADLSSLGHLVEGDATWRYHVHRRGTCRSRPRHWWLQRGGERLPFSPSDAGKGPWRKAVCGGNQRREPGLQQTDLGTYGRRDHLRTARGDREGGIDCVLQHRSDASVQQDNLMMLQMLGGPRCGKARQLGIVERSAGLLTPSYNRSRRSSS